MKHLIIFFVILLFAVWAGVVMYNDPGYVLVAYKSWSLETTLWATILSILVLFIILYFLITLFRGASSASYNISSWTTNRFTRKARRVTNLGLCEWAEGKWQSAEKKLIKAAKHSDIPLLNYLIAARAAQAQGEYDRRDTYLRLAHASTPGVEVAVGLTQAQLQLAAGQLERALATLTHLRHLEPKHTYVMNLLQQVYVKLRDWESLRALLPVLHKYKALDSKQLQKLEQELYSELIAHESNLEVLANIWAKIPIALQNNVELLLAYSDALIKHNAQDIAEKVLRNALKKSWNNKLVTNYGLIASDLAKQLETAESWLKAHKNDPSLLLCLGRLCKQQKLLDKAQNYLESCINIKSNPTAYRELGQIMELKGDQNAALKYYRKGLLSEK
jgi:HemY protein